QCGAVTAAVEALAGTAREPADRGAVTDGRAGSEDPGPGPAGRGPRAGGGRGQRPLVTEATERLARGAGGGGGRAGVPHGRRGLRTGNRRGPAADLKARPAVTGAGPWTGTASRTRCGFTRDQG